MPRNAGKRLERLLGPTEGCLSTHQLYENRGQAIIRKIEVPMIKNKMTGQWTFARRTHFDYSGCLRGGRHIGVEAKEISGEQLPIGSAGLKPHQLEALIKFHKLGAITGVLWMPDPDHAWWLSGQFLEHFQKNVYEKPYKYISLDLVKQMCPQVMKNGFIDYLPAALKGEESCLSKPRS